MIDCLTSMGCRDAEIVRLGGGGVAWRGAVYTAVPVEQPGATTLPVAG